MRDIDWKISQPIQSAENINLAWVRMDVDATNSNIGSSAEVKHIRTVLRRRPRAVDISLNFH